MDGETMHKNERAINKVKSIVASVLKVRVEELQVYDGLNTIPEWDSLAHLYVIAAIEEEIGALVSDEDFEKLTTITAIVKYFKECSNDEIR